MNDANHASTPDNVAIADAIIAGIGSDDNALAQMVEIIKALDRAGYEIRPKEPRP